MKECLLDTNILFTAIVYEGNEIGGRRIGRMTSRFKPNPELKEGEKLIMGVIEPKKTL